MHIYDISVEVTPAIPVWPGDPSIVFERVGKIEAGDESNVTRLVMTTHTGTHIDAPRHFFQEGKTLDEVPLSVLIGRTYVLDLPDVDFITADVLIKANLPPRLKRILFKTKNTALWSKYPTSFYKKYVSLSPDAAQYLVDRKVQMVGVDYLSVAPFEDPTPTHRVLLGAGTLILEGLNLSEIHQGHYTLYCLPLKLGGTDGAPVRAVLLGA